MSVKTGCWCATTTAMDKSTEDANSSATKTRGSRGQPLKFPVNVNKLIICGLCLVLLSCSKTDSNLDAYFSRLATGKDQVDFPYKISNTDTVCVLQAYQNRVRSQPVVMPVTDAINAQLDKADFRGEEGVWILVRFSEGAAFVHKINRYNAQLSSPNDSDHNEWETGAGKRSAECASGAQLKFSVFINQATGKRRVGIMSSDGE